MKRLEFTMKSVLELFQLYLGVTSPPKLYSKIIELQHLNMFGYILEKF